MGTDELLSRSGLSLAMFYDMLASETVTTLTSGVVTFAFRSFFLGQ